MTCLCGVPSNTIGVDLRLDPENVTLPVVLQAIAFNGALNLNFENMTQTSGPLTITLSLELNLGLVNVMLLSGKRIIIFGFELNQASKMSRFHVVHRLSHYEGSVLFVSNLFWLDGALWRSSAGSGRR